MCAVTAFAPAKINLTLDIVGTRPDGYHLLESIFQSVASATLSTSANGGEKALR